MNAEKELLSVQKSPNARTAPGHTDVFVRKDIQPCGEMASNIVKVRCDDLFQRKPDVTIKFNICDWNLNNISTSMPKKDHFRLVFFAHRKTYNKNATNHNISYSLISYHGKTTTKYIW